MDPDGERRVLGIWFAVIVGWAWLTVLSLGLKRLA
jgi:hypothetical protein